VPNWGGALRRVRAAEAAAAAKAGGDLDAAAFDALYVVDPARNWYGGGDESELGAWRERLAPVAARYERVLFIGDSMGATGALLLADLATAVHAFTPQVDLMSASIRPGRGAGWAAALRARAHAAAAVAPGRVTAHVGTWRHDLDQVAALPAADVHVRLYSVDSHRLALALDRVGRLVPTLRAAVHGELGLPTPEDVRLANLL
jgi:hypothetical protein